MSSYTNKLMPYIKGSADQNRAYIVMLIEGKGGIDRKEVRKLIKKVTLAATALREILGSKKRVTRTKFMIARLKLMNETALFTVELARIQMGMSSMLKLIVYNDKSSLEDIFEMPDRFEFFMSRIEEINIFDSVEKEVLRLVNRYRNVLSHSTTSLVLISSDEEWMNIMFDFLDAVSMLYDDLSLVVRPSLTEYVDRGLPTDLIPKPLPLDS